MIFVFLVNCLWAMWRFTSFLLSDEIIINFFRLWIGSEWGDDNRKWPSVDWFRHFTFHAWYVKILVSYPVFLRQWLFPRWNSDIAVEREAEGDLLLKDMGQVCSFWLEISLKGWVNKSYSLSKREKWRNIWIESHFVFLFIVTHWFLFLWHYWYNLLLAIKHVLTFSCDFHSSYWNYMQLSEMKLIGV